MYVYENPEEEASFSITNTFCPNQKFYISCDNLNNIHHQLCEYSTESVQFEESTDGSFVFVL